MALRILIVLLSITAIAARRINSRQSGKTLNVVDESSKELEELEKPEELNAPRVFQETELSDIFGDLDKGDEHWISTFAFHCEHKTQYRVLLPTAKAIDNRARMQLKWMTGSDGMVIKPDTVLLFREGTNWNNMDRATFEKWYSDLDSKDSGCPGKFKIEALPNFNELPKMLVFEESKLEPIFKDPKKGDGHWISLSAYHCEDKKEYKVLIPTQKATETPTYIKLAWMGSEPEVIEEDLVLTKADDTEWDDLDRDEFQEQYSSSSSSTCPGNFNFEELQAPGPN